MLLNGLFQNPIVAGYKSPLGQQCEYDYDPTRGYIIRWHYEGVSQEDMFSLQQQYVQNGIACRITFRDGRAFLECVDSTQEYAFDSWEIEGQFESIDPFMCPNVQLELNAIPTQATADELIAAIRSNLANDTPAFTATGNGGAFASKPLSYIAYGVPNPTGSPFPVFQATEYIYTLALAGLNGYENVGDGTGYILQHKTNVSNRSQTNIADFGVGQIYSTAQLLSEVTNDGLWNNPLPTRLAYKLAAIEPPPMRPNWMIGWMKGRSTENTTANNRVEINQSYTFGQFTLAMYSPYSG